MIRRPFALCLAACLAAAGAASAATVQVIATSTPDGAFVPQTVTIRVGDTVRWTNVDGMHNVVADDNTWTSGSPAVAPWTFSRTFTAAGTVGYNCNLHGQPGSGMFGTVIVLDSIELGHGSQVTEDLAGAPDRYRLGQKPFSSYEVVVDAVAGNPSLALDRLDATGTAVLQAGQAVSSIDMTQSLRWENTSTTAVDSERVRVGNTPCGTACSANDVYALRAYETTLAIPRYNQTGTQTTVVVLQNPTNYTVAGHAYFWTGAGVLANPGGSAFTIAAKSAFVLGAGAVPGVAGTSGTITVAHDARYGDLTGKAVAIEPATGFTFDTAAVSRAR
ncbi:MAG: plastocyanin/azurin family copper-binding protein [Vicinamibacteria bacterium]